MGADRDDLADDDHRGRAHVLGDRALTDVREGRVDPALGCGGALLDERDRGGRVLAVGDQGGRDGADLVDGHEEDQGAAQPGDRLPVDQGARVLRRDMAADHGELVGDAPVGDRDTGCPGDGDGAGDPGDDRAGDALGGQRLRLLHAPAEDERVAALEPDHGLARLGVLDQRLVDRLLGHEPAVRDLRRVDHLDVRRQFVEQVAGAEAVGDDHVGLGEEAAAAHRDQVRVAGAAADQGDAGGVVAVVRGGDGAVAQALDDGVAEGGGVAGVAALGGGVEDGDGDVVDAAGGRGPGGRGLGVVGPYAPGAGALGLGGGGVVGGGVGGGDEDVPGVGEVAVLVAAALPADLPGVRHGLDGSRRGRGDQGDDGTGGDELREPALRDLAAADDYGAAAVEAQADGVRGVIVLTCAVGVVCVLGHGGAGSSCGVLRRGRCGGGAAVTCGSGGVLGRGTRYGVGGGAAGVGACGGPVPSPPLPGTGAPPRAPFVLKRRTGWGFGAPPRAQLLKRRRG
ncbi:protein of unknown function [Streptomyces sp. KY70]|nr:protein of unknown function [Streptomyces sp. KY70]